MMNQTVYGFDKICTCLYARDKKCKNAKSWNYLLQLKAQKQWPSDGSLKLESVYLQEGICVVIEGIFLQIVLLGPSV